MEGKRFKVNVTNHDKIDGHVTYFLNIETDSKMNFTIPKRYSELKTLNDLLRKETTNNTFPKFPPKKFFGFNTEEFINKRQQELNTYFTAISNSKEFSNLPSFIKFIEDCIKNQNNNKLMSERPTMITGNQIISQKKSKSSINSYRERFRPDKIECKRLSPEELKNQDEEFKKIVNDCKDKFVNIDYQVKQNMSEQTEKKYKKIIKEDKTLNFIDKDSDNLQSGNDDNFNLISDIIDNIDAEVNLNKKMEEIISKEKEILSFYDINEILKSL